MADVNQGDPTPAQSSTPAASSTPAPPPANADAGAASRSTPPGRPSAVQADWSPRALAVLALFFFSGASGLIYEIVWMRLLTYIFGATHYAVATVLAAFMGGLALGSLWFGPLADRSKNPLRLYALLEFAIGAFACALPLVLRAADPLYRAMYNGLPHDFGIYTLCRFVVTFLILLVPSTCLGATLPVLSRWAVRSLETVGISAGRLYAANTFGAVCGVFAAGFILISLLGVNGTIFLAVGVNLLVAASAYMLTLGEGEFTIPPVFVGTESPFGDYTESNSHSVPWEAGSAQPKFVGQENFIATSSSERSPLSGIIPNPTPTTQSPIPTTESGAHAGVPQAQPELPGNVEETITPQLQRWVFWVYGGSGLIALAYQLVWFRTLVFSFLELKNTTYAFSAMLTVFLIGLAAGSAVGSRIADTLTHPARCFGLVQLAIGVSGAFSFFMIYQFTPHWAPFAVFSGDEQFHFSAAVANLFLKTFAAILIPTFLMGLAFPVAVRVLVSTAAAGTDVGRLYAVNTLGAILGAILGGFVLIPLFTLTYTLYLLSVANIAFALAILLQLREIPPQSKNVLAGLGLAVALVIWFKLPGQARFQEVVLGKGSERIVSAGAAGSLPGVEPETAYYEGPLATVAVVENSIGERELRIDNVGVAGTDQILLTDQKSLAHVPMLFLKNPKRALTVGFGSGGASWSYLQYPQMEKVTCVEICREVLRMAKFLTASNHGLLEQRDPRFEIIIDDARSYLRFTAASYDVIATDCTDLRYKTNANLYDVEYFQICKSRLTEQGMVVVWMPLGGLSREALLVALRTFARVFPDMSIWYLNNAPTHYILLLGTRSGGLKIDYPLMQERLALPAVRQDLAEIGLADADKILSCYVTNAALLGEALRAGPLNTETRPYLEFKSPLYGYGDRPLLDNLDFLMQHRGDVSSYLDPQRAPTGFAAQLQPWRDAVATILRGHKHYRLNELAAACEQYLAAEKINPADAAVRELLKFRELKTKTVTQPNNSWAQLMLGEILRLQHRPHEAFDYYTQALRLLAGNPPQAGYQQQLLNQKLISDCLLGSAECMLQAGVTRHLAGVVADIEALVNTFPELGQAQARLAELKQHLPQSASTSPAPPEQDAPAANPAPQPEVAPQTPGRN